MRVEETAEKLIDTIAIPVTVSERQALIARKYVQAIMQEGFNVQTFCKGNNLSTKTFYKWLENPDFKYYLDELQNKAVPQDERLAYEKLKKHILKIADKSSPTLKEIELFTETFSYIVKIDQQERMRELGLSEDNKPLTNNTIEEKKAVLLKRLMK